MSHRNTMYSVVELTLCKLLISISLKHRKMKRSVTFFVLALITTVIADHDESLEEIANKLKTDVPTLQACMNEDGIKKEDLITWLQTWADIMNIKKEDLNEKLTQACLKCNSGAACLLEKKGLMVDNKLIVDKMIDEIKTECSKYNVSQPSDEFITSVMECYDSLNDNNQLTREDRTIGSVMCIIDSIALWNKKEQ